MQELILDGFDHENNVENKKCFDNIKGDFYTSFQIMLISKRE